MTTPTPPKKIVSVVFFKETTGSEPVRKWLKSLSKENRKIIGNDIKTVETGWPLGMPLVKYLGGQLWEVRSTFKNGIARVIFKMKGHQMVLLHGFVKKTQKTLTSDLKVARNRAKKIED